MSTFQLTPKQEVAAYKLHKAKSGAVWWRVGTGKTRIGFKLFATIANLTSTACRFLVVCRREAFGDWIDEMEKVGLDWDTRILEQAGDFVGFLSHLDKSEVSFISHGKLQSLQNWLVPNAIHYNGVILDEGFLYKNPHSDHCKIANHIAINAVFCWILSGSIMTAKNLEDVFGQLYAINQHHVLARTLTEFRSKFMIKFHIKMGERDVPKLVMRKGSTKQIAKLIAPISSIYFPKNSEREIYEEVVSIPPSEEQLKAFLQLQSEFSLDLKGGGYMELKNTPSMITKCQQISDGWLKSDRMFFKATPSLITKCQQITDGLMDSKKENVIFYPNQKVVWLMSKIDELISCGERVVIWCAFRNSVHYLLQQLQKQLPHLSKNCYSLLGGEKFDVANWKRNGLIMIGTEASGSSVNHFDQCAYAIYYSMDAKWLSLQQSQGRTDRKSSKHNKCFYYYLQTKGSLDRMVYRMAKTSQHREAELIKQGELQSWHSKTLELLRSVPKGTSKLIA